LIFIPCILYGFCRSFLTGFRSRKIERRKAAQAEITKLAREAKVAERAERKEAKQTELELLESRSGGILPNPKKKLKSAEAHLALAHDNGNHDDSDSDSGTASESGWLWILPFRPLYCFLFLLALYSRSHFHAAFLLFS
jgi:hypothetical protein